MYLIGLEHEQEEQEQRRSLRMKSAEESCNAPLVTKALDQHFLIENPISSSYANLVSFSKTFDLQDYSIAMLADGEPLSLEIKYYKMFSSQFGYSKIFDLLLS